MRSGCVQRRDRTSQKTNWVNVGGFAIFHLGAVAALFDFSWPACAVAIFLFWMCTGLGISMGYHRLHTHRSYQVPLGLEYFFAVCGTLTLEGARSSGWRPTESIIKSRTNPATRIRRGMVVGGLTWAAFWLGKASTMTPRSCRNTRPIWQKIISMSG